MQMLLYNIDFLDKTFLKNFFSKAYIVL